MSMMKFTLRMMGWKYHNKQKACVKLKSMMQETEITENQTVGNTMQICFHLRDGGEIHIKHAYDVLTDGATTCTPMGPCDYSPCMFSLIDKFGRYWCLFV